MLFLNFLYATCLLILGVIGLLNVEEPPDVRALGLPGLFFGGAVLFCSCYAIKEPRHGVAGASFLAFLAFLTSAATMGGHLFRSTLDFGTPLTRSPSASSAFPQSTSRSPS